MNKAKEFVRKIIEKNQCKILEKVKTMPKVLSVGLISMLGLLPLAAIPNRGITAYAQHVQEQSQLPPPTDPWYQSLEIARSKVEAALSAGAFGHGVPSLHNLSTNEILLTFGITVMGSILTFIAVRMLLSRKRNTGKEKNIMVYQ